MKVNSCCLPCLKGLAEKTATLSGSDKNLIDDCSRLIEKLWDTNTTPPAISNTLLKHIKRTTGVHDPYSAAKREEFKKAVKAVHELRNRFEDSLEGAIKLAALGNSLDFFIDGHYDLNNFKFVGAMDKIQETIYIKGRDILMLGDNIGDFIFDIPLVD
jgi:uncharacterized protein with ATP-grasp and redox domains